MSKQRAEVEEEQKWDIWMAFWEGDAIVTYIYPSSSLPSTDLVHVTLPFDL